MCCRIALDPCPFLGLEAISPEVSRVKVRVKVKVTVKVTVMVMVMVK